MSTPNYDMLIRALDREQSHTANEIARALREIGNMNSPGHSQLTWYQRGAAAIELLHERMDAFDAVADELARVEADKLADLPIVP